MLCSVAPPGLARVFVAYRGLTPPATNLRPCRGCVVIMLVASAVSSGCIQSSNDALHAAPKDESKPAAKAPATPPQKMLVVKAERKTLSRTTEQPGRIIAYEETPLYAKTTGFVATVHVDLGDKVAGPQVDAQGKITREGKLLAELSLPETEDELQQKAALITQAQAVVVQAQARVRVAAAEVTSAKAKRVEAQAAIARSEADYKRWKSELARISELAATSSVTRKLVDETENQLQAADAVRRESNAKVESADAFVAEAEANQQKAAADVTAAQASLRVAEADHSRVKTLLGYTRIRAPFDGVVTERNVHTGHLVQPGNSQQSKPLFVVVRTDPVRIVIDVPESEAGLTGEKDQVRIRIPSLGMDLTGPVTRTAWVLDATSRTLRTVVDIPNPEGKLRPGMYANAMLTVAERPNVVVVPVSAVASGADKQPFCWTVEGKQLVRKPVTFGLRAGTEIEITTGLGDGDVIVKSNSPGLTEGQAIDTVIEPPPPAKK